MKKKESVKMTAKKDLHLKRARAAKTFDNITYKIAQKESTRAIGEIQAKRDEVWSNLANQVVGAEQLKH